MPSTVSELTGSAQDVARLETIFRELEARVVQLVDSGGVEAIGLTGIREGLAIVDTSSGLCWVSGNGDSPAWGPPPSGDGLVFLSLQGYLAHRLTGALRATHAERIALGIGSESEPLAPAAATARDRASIPTPCAVGETIGWLRDAQRVEVFLAGTDEQAGYFGAQVGERCDLFLSTGSFWGLARRATPPPAPTLCPALRQVPAAPPCPAYVAFVGYRWGQYLAKLAADARPEVPAELPRWAAGTFVVAVRDGDIDLAGAVELIRRDLSAAAAVLWRHARRPHVRVAGGGVSQFPELVVECLPPTWHCEVFQQDATLLGVARIAHTRKTTRFR